MVFYFSSFTLIYVAGLIVSVIVVLVVWHRSVDREHQYLLCDRVLNTNKLKRRVSYGGSD
jgi:hypothetical protein